MNPMHSSGARRLALKPLAACLAAVLGVGAASTTAAVPRAVAATHAPSMRAAHRAHALTTFHPRLRAAHRATGPQPEGGVTLLVTSCADDSSGGTLREVVAVAGDGDTVDLGTLTCSSITLTQGAIAVGVDNLILVGPAAATLTLDGANASRVISHTGTGTLTIDHLAIGNGLYEGTSMAAGGCVYSAADVVLTHASIDSCVAGSGTNTGFGGGVFAAGTATVTDSSITNSVAAGDGGSGGGVMSYNGAVQVTRSTISGNSGYGGGGVFSRYGDLTIDSSTISGNTGSFGGGAYTYGGYNTTVTNSTISGNTATGGGGIQAYYQLTLHNSTVAFNTADSGGGVQLFSYAPEITSSIIANNSSTTSANDLGGGAGLTVGGSNNLIMSSDATTPGDTLTGDPGLLPLSNNGGTTQTHALGIGSIALDVGLNADGLLFDQRGSGFARSAGTATDIGAYEDQGTSDVIFADGFDGP